MTILLSVSVALFAIASGMSLMILASCFVDRRRAAEYRRSLQAQPSPMVAGRKPSAVDQAASNRSKIDPQYIEEQIALYRNAYRRREKRRTNRDRAQSEVGSGSGFAFESA